MPRAFSADERKAIESRIRAAGRRQFALLGLRKTTVSDLARSAAIAKGSFYLFFRSKEALLSSILQEEEAELRREVREQMSRPHRSARNRFAHFLKLHFQSLDSHPLLRMLRDPIELEALSRSLPPGAFEQAQADDDAFFMRFISQWQHDGAVSPHSKEAMEGLGRALRTLNLYRDVIGKARFGALTDLLAEGLAEALCPDSSGRR